MISNPRPSISISSLALLLLALSGCGGEERLVVGATLPLSGPAAAYGIAVQEGMLLAHQQLQAEQRFGRASDLFAAYGYDAMRTLAAAAADQGASETGVWKGLQSLRELRGVTGYIQFDERGAVGAFPRVYVVRGGRIAEYGDGNRRLELASRGGPGPAVGG